ncbi:GreA/GreB family elongation factor [Myxococcota bacterium]|nr:GreA/GreB family elongation factor [Myxococcota bacterium]
MRVVLTVGGKRRLQQRLALVRAEFDAVVADNPAALESGDSSGWHDNFAFEDNQRRMHQLAHRLRELERVVDRAEVVPPLSGIPERVVVGAGVRWRFEDGGADAGGGIAGHDEAQWLWVAGFEDGDPPRGRVSYDSPLGRALLGASEGELREVVIAGRRRQVEVLELGPTPPGADGADLHERGADLDGSGAVGAREVA